MGALDCGMMKSAAQVALVALALAVLASAAPIAQQNARDTLWDQQTDLYNAMLQIQDDDLPFDGDVTDKHEGTFDAQNQTVAARNEYQKDMMMKPFKVSAARDDAENSTRVEEEAHVAESLKTYRDQQNATAEKAIEAGEATDKQADETEKAVTESVHETLHPDDPEQEQTNNEFLHSVAKYAEAADVPMRHGDMYEPDNLGDPFSKTSLPTAADMLVAEDGFVSKEEKVVQDMKKQEAAALDAQQALYDEVLSA